MKIVVHNILLTNLAIMNKKLYYEIYLQSNFFLI